jgi:hypothetical protein
MQIKAVFGGVRGYGVMDVIGGRGEAAEDGKK